ncbi:FAD-binding oxidoreductase [Bacteroidota bacterium]
MKKIKAKSLSGEDIIINSGSIEKFKNQLSGKLLLEADSDYDEARKIWNGMIDRKPALIVRATEESDIVNSVNFARDNNILLSVKGGGHNIAGNAVCEGGLMLDLSLRNSVEVNETDKTVVVESGCLLGDVDKETQKHGLAVSAGIVSHTGVAGLTLGGGFGWISRKYGMTIDNLISADIITADGATVTTSKDQNQDLFWGIRGGGGNFGVVSSFKFKGAEIGKEVFCGLIVFPYSVAKEYIQFHRDYVRTLPEDMTVWMVLRKAPPLPFLPESVHGELVVAVPFVFLGDQEKGEKLINPIREFAEIHGEHVGMQPFDQWQVTFDGLVSHGARNYWKSHSLKGLPDDCIDKVVEYVNKLPSPHCEVFIAHLEGAQSRVPESETAYAFRKSPFVINMHTRWDDESDDEKCIQWARNFFESTKQYADGVYVNFVSDSNEKRIKEAYSPESWDRLVVLKDKYDPNNLFRMNQNIKPSNNK